MELRDIMSVAFTVFCFSYVFRLTLSIYMDLKTREYVCSYLKIINGKSISVGFANLIIKGRFNFTSDYERLIEQVRNEHQEEVDIAILSVNEVRDD